MSRLALSHLLSPSLSVSPVERPSGSVDTREFVRRRFPVAMVGGWVGALPLRKSVVRCFVRAAQPPLALVVCLDAAFGVAGAGRAGEDGGDGKLTHPKTSLRFPSRLGFRSGVVVLPALFLGRPAA